MGVWKIKAHYEDSPQQVFSTEFEVKEYGKRAREPGLGGGGRGECIRLGPVLVRPQHNLSPQCFPVLRSS